MARTVADGYMPRLAPSGVMALAMTKPEVEAGEPELEAVPRIGRAAFLYLEPRPGLDGAGYFAQCASCSSFVPEAFGRGAFRGARCALFGSSMPVTDDSSCGLFTPWASGMPCDEIVACNAGQIAGGLRAAVTPTDAGYVADTKVRCRNCRFVDMEGDGTGAPECEFFEHLNKTCPSLFMLDTKVALDGCCNAWTPPAPAPAYE